MHYHEPKKLPKTLTACLTVNLDSLLADVTTRGSKLVNNLQYDGTAQYDHIICGSKAVKLLFVHCFLANSKLVKS